MKTSESIIKIVPAILLAQKKIETVKKEANNPFFHSKYADLNSLIDACKKILNDNDVLILQPIVGDFVETRLIHTSGEWITSKTRIISKEANNPQAQGSAITYARRYGLQSMLFMSAEDDDGNNATGHKEYTPNTYSKPAPVQSTQPMLATIPQKKMFFALAQQMWGNQESALAWVKTQFKVESLNDITLEQMKQVLDAMTKKKIEKDNFEIDPTVIDKTY